MENVKYNLGREYKFYAIILQGQRSKGGTAVAIEKINSSQKTEHKNNSPGSSSAGLQVRGKKKDNVLNISTPNRPSDRYNLLCLNKKEETYYRAYNASYHDGCKSTIDLTLANLMIVQIEQIIRTQGK